VRQQKSAVDQARRAGRKRHHCDVVFDKRNAFRGTRACKLEERARSIQADCSVWAQRPRDKMGRVARSAAQIKGEIELPFREIRKKSATRRVEDLRDLRKPEGSKIALAEGVSFSVPAYHG
jgi:hypothetical protein